MKCQNQKNNKYCKGKTGKELRIINQMRVCEQCYWKIKQENKK